jgi:hypothetical protein
LELGRWWEEWGDRYLSCSEELLHTGTGLSTNLSPYLLSLSTSQNILFHILTLCSFTSSFSSSLKILYSGREKMQEWNSLAVNLEVTLKVAVHLV